MHKPPTRRYPKAKVDTTTVWEIKYLDRDNFGNEPQTTVVVGKKELDQYLGRHTLQILTAKKV